MNNPLFSGVCTALVTPFLGDCINYPMMERLLQRQIDAGIEAVVICGTTGEAPTLTDAEKLELFSRAKKYTGNHCKIIAGTGSNSTIHTVELSKAAEQCGVDGLLIVSPYYNKATAEGLKIHYTAAAQAVKIPVVAYNVPSRTGLDIPLQVYEQLCRVDNIVGIKEASTDIRKTAKIMRTCGNHLTLWSGNDDMTVPMISLGAKGVISVLSNVVPLQTQAMAQAALAGDFYTASAIQIELQPLIELLFCEVNPIPVKAAMNIIGYDCGQCRLPLSNLREDNYRKLESVLKT